MKKTIGFLCVIVAILFSSYFFFKKHPVQPLAQQGKDIEYISLYHYFSGSLSGGLNEMIALINKQHSEKKIVSHALDHEAFKSMILSTLTKGAAPELFTYWAGAKTQELVDNDQLEILDGIWEQYSFNKILPASLVETASTYNGKKYFLPLDRHIVVFFYNRQIFEKLHLSPPVNWDDMLRLVRSLKENSIIPFSLGAFERWPAQFWFDYLLLRTAGPHYRIRLMNGNASYTDDEVLAVYKIWSELIQNRYFNDDVNEIDWSQATQLVCDGKAAMTLMGTWAIQKFTGDKCTKEEEIDFDFFPFPLMNQNILYSAVGPVDGLVLTKNSSNTTLAKLFLPFFLDEGPQQAFSRGSGAFAPGVNIQKEFYSPLKQRILKEIEAAQYWAFNYDLATPSIVADYGMNSFNELLEIPEEYKTILEDLENQTRDFFSKTHL